MLRQPACNAPYLGHHLVYPIEDVLVSKPKDGLPTRLKEGVPGPVTLGPVHMSLAVDFNAEPHVRAVEVDRVAVEGVLIPKLVAVQPSTS